MIIDACHAGSAGGSAYLNESEWAVLGRSVAVKPEDRRPQPPWGDQSDRPLEYQVVKMRLLVDGLNTLPEKQSNKGISAYLVGPSVANLDEARGYTLDPARSRVFRVSWAHLLAYNLIRTVIVQAAAKHGKHPRKISFTRAMRTLEAFRPTITQTTTKQLPALYERMLQAIASHATGNRLDRLEPRQRKRRPKPYKLMTTPRNQARKQEVRTR